MKYTVITGAGSGLGKAFASECAQKGRNLILAALPGEDICSTANELAVNYRICTHFWEADFTRVGETEEFADWLCSHFQIDMLINNAGVGGTQSFTETSYEYLDNIMMLNMRALVILTHKLVPVLKRNKASYILNISSMAAFGPMPYKTVYPASKTFVWSFSRGLYEELKGTGVFVSVAHPGGMATNPDVTERIKQYGRVVRATVLTPEKTAAICYRQLLRKDSLIIPGFMNKINWLVFKIVPIWMRLHLMNRAMKKELNVNYA